MLAGKLGVHFSVDSSGILKVDKAESVIEVWEDYEVEIPVSAPNRTIENVVNASLGAREALEDDDADNSEVQSALRHDQALR